MNNRQIAGFGWKPDIPDARDFIATTPALPRDAANAINLATSPWMPPIYDQGYLGSCVANVVAALAEYRMRKTGLVIFTPSRLAIYYYARAIEGAIGADTGCQIRDGFKVLTKKGIGPETLWPYLQEQWNIPPNNQFLKSCIPNRGAFMYASVPNNPEILKQHLLAGNPIACGISVFTSFPPVHDTAGRVQLPASGERLQSTHCILLTGFNDHWSGSPTYFFRNSWGAGWGSHGYAAIPQDYIHDDRLARDFWVLT